MSTNVNSQLFDRASDCIDYFFGKLPAELIEADIFNADLDSLQKHVLEAEAVMSQENFHFSESLNEGDEY